MNYMILFVCISCWLNYTEPEATKIAVFWKSEEEAEEFVATLKDALKWATAEAVAEAIPFGASFLEFFKTFYEEATVKQTLWDQISNNVHHSIGAANVDMKLDDLNNNIDSVERRIRESNSNYAHCDYKDAMDFMDKAFPQNHKSLQWNEKLPLIAIRYLTLVVQIYTIRWENDPSLRCKLGERLVEFRASLLAGMKEMVSKRYRLITPVTSDGYGDTKPGYEYVKFNKGNPRESDKMKVYILPDGKNESTVKARLMDYWDPRTPNITAFTIKSWNFKIDQVKKKVLRFLMEDVVSKANKYFNPSICLSGCPCPSPIEEKEFDVDWPKDCMDADNSCNHPCGKFGWDENWCWNNENWSKPSSPTCKSCTPVKIQTCLEENELKKLKETKDKREQNKNRKTKKSRKRNRNKFKEG